MSGHTPGPWTYRRGWRAGNREWGGWIVGVGASHFWAAHKNICDEKSRGEYAEAVGGKEAEANACLIASAPTMREYIQRKAEGGDKEARKILASVDA